MAKRIAADAENLGDPFEPFAQTLGHLAQDCVAARIAEAGMNGFEAVDVQQRKRRVGETRAALLELFHQRDAIAEPGQRIAQRAIQGLGLGRPCAR